jgi:S-adenosylmethionine decarboxylase
MYHLLLKMFVPDRMLRNDRKMLSIFHGALDKSNAHIRRTVEYPFSPAGFTAVAILGESHASLHTWPENRFAIIDYFSCSDNTCFDSFVAYLESNEMCVIERLTLTR